MGMLIRLKEAAKVNGGLCFPGTVTKVADRHATALINADKAEPADAEATAAWETANPKLAARRKAKVLQRAEAPRRRVEAAKAAVDSAEKAKDKADKAADKADASAKKAKGGAKEGAANGEAANAKRAAEMAVHDLDAAKNELANAKAAIKD